MSAAESGHDIVFLHEIQVGPASRSYGIQVARLAGMPVAVVNQARQTLAALEAVDPDALSPREALDALYQLKTPAAKG